MTSVLSTLSIKIFHFTEFDLFPVSHAGCQLTSCTILPTPMMLALPPHQRLHF